MRQPRPFFRFSREATGPNWLSTKTVAPASHRDEKSIARYTLIGGAAVCNRRTAMRHVSSSACSSISCVIPGNRTSSRRSRFPITISMWVTSGNGSSRQSGLVGVLGNAFPQNNPVQSNTIFQNRGGHKAKISKRGERAFIGSYRPTLVSVSVWMGG